MQFKVFTLRFSNRLEMFDDAPVGDFIKDKEVLCLRDYFFMRDALPYLAVVVVYQPSAEPAIPHPPGTRPDAPTANPRQRDESWRELLTEADMPLFNTLRDWRSGRCKKDGIPPYVICNNRQLAQIVHSRPTTLSGLMQVDGFGKAKAEKYGEVMLKLLATPMAAPAPTSHTLPEVNHGAA